MDGIVEDTVLTDEINVQKESIIQHDDEEQQPVQLHQPVEASNQVDAVESNKKDVKKKTLPDILTESFKLYSDIRPIVNESTSQTSAETEVEMAIVSKMRDYKRKIAFEYGPYAEIDLEELLNPQDPLENILLKTTKAHGLNNMYLDAVARNIMNIIESTHDYLKTIYTVASIVQGDDPRFQNLGFDQDDQELLEARETIQQYVNNDVLFIEKLQEIRGKVTYVQARKREFLKSLKDRFGSYYEEYTSTENY